MSQADKTSGSIELQQSYELRAEQIEQFRRDGVFHAREVLSSEILTCYGEEISRIAASANPFRDVPLEQRDAIGKAFIQIGQLWTRNPFIKELVFSRRLAKMAADLMGTSGVRVWQDQLLFKEPGGGHTPWHADAHYFPMASDAVVTLWIPLHDVPLEMGPLSFAKNSHEHDLGRDLSISDISEERIGAAIADGGFEILNEPFALGDISFHSGWTMHRAGPNTTNQPRRIFTIVYMDKNMQLADPTNEAQRTEIERMINGIGVGEVMDTIVTPVVFSR